MSKQDRQGARTPADLERKYDLGMNFGEVKELVNYSQREAADAKAAVAELDHKLDQDELVKRITEDGNSPVLYFVGDALYINASYIKGVLKSADGTSVVIDLDNNTVSLSCMDAIEAQTAYTAMMTDTLSVNPTKAKIEKWYDASLWTAAMVNNAVTKGVLTSAEATEITG